MGTITPENSPGPTMEQIEMWPLATGSHLFLSFPTQGRIKGGGVNGGNCLRPYATVANVFVTSTTAVLNHFPEGSQIQTYNFVRETH